MKWTTTSPLH